MWTLLLILSFLILDSRLTDPCVNPTILEEPWRSIDCSETECSGQLKCDKDLKYGWYRFNSSGGGTIPESVVPAFHCSTHRSGWLQGSHPTVGQGEVNRTVCFNFDGNCCSWTREIKIKNCSSYFVYELKPAPGCYAVYCTVTDSAVTEPCVNHTVLDQPWRSTDCTETGCTDLKCDDKLNHGWYRLKSSGGWKIPETVVTERHCSTRATGWLQGSHPTVGQGEVTRTVCLNWDGSPRNWVHEIKIKNCSSYFVYELKSLHHCAAYCTDPNTAQTQEKPEHSSPKPADLSSSPQAASVTSDQGKKTTPESGEHSTRESTFAESSSPTGSELTEPKSSQKEGSEDQCSRESTRRTSFVSVGSLDSAVLDLSEVDCDQVNAEVQVMYVGKNKLDPPEVHEMLKKYLPCKKLVPKLQEGTGNGKNKE